MIVLDEQLLGRSLEMEIARWYTGDVCFITDLRPNTVVKDDAIPYLLRQHSQPTFVTINERDFWRKVAVSDRFCVVCFSLPDSRAEEIPGLLRALFHNPLFATKRLRMGRVILVTGRGTSYYTHDDREIKVVEL
jgi:hypothetical protein